MVTKSYKTKEVQTMKRFLAAAGAVLILTLSPATASPAPMLTINGVTTESNVIAYIQNDTTYVFLRNAVSLLDDHAEVVWANNKARITNQDVSLTAQPGNDYITVNDEMISVPYGVQVDQGRILLPLRVLAQAFNASVHWDPSSYEITVVSDLKSETPTYSDEDLYWLSRIISAESKGESLEGKIAVGNVVLNRVASPDFPNTIYDVIFDDRWGGQFEPVRNGTVYQTPTEESIQAAKLCLEGTNVAGDSLYFLAPALAQNFWVPQNCEYITTIGCHDFYR